jgi:xanthine dehydrogenase small subunit
METVHVVANSQTQAQGAGMNGISRNIIRFRLDGQTIEVRDPEPTLTLLQFLREQLGRTGTKEGCAEGDCGACTVVLGKLQDNRIHYESINSCIRFLVAIDGCEVVTVESLADAQGDLHPVQQAMVDQHASQCGFCTPGFVMSLFNLYLQHEQEPAREEVVQQLTGNLCRCTGYRPIIDAGLGLFAYPKPKRWSREDAFGKERIEALQALQDPLPIAASGPAGRTLVPCDLTQLQAALQQHPDAVLVAGATDVGLWATKELRQFDTLIHLTRIPELNRMAIDPQTGILSIGATVSLEMAYRELVRQYPELRELHERFASPPIRHSGTLGGNVANGSPIGDSMPFLLALGARVRLLSAEGERVLPLEDLYIDYRVNALRAGEIVQAIEIPPRPPGLKFATYKISKRRDQDISAICAAFAIMLDSDGKVTEARIGYGGMAGIPKRASQTEAALIGRAWESATISDACQILRLEFTPLSDMRASAGYRREVAANLLLRFFVQTSEGASHHA